MEEDQLWIIYHLLGPILFNIFICDMFLLLHETQFIGYADDNTPFVVRDNVPDVI